MVSERQMWPTSQKVLSTTDLKPLIGLFTPTCFSNSNK